MVLGERGVRQLNMDRDVHCDKDEKQGVGHEVLLTVVAQRLLVLARFLVDLDRYSMDRLVTYERNAEP